MSQDPTSAEIEAVLQEAVDAVKSRNDGALPADDLMVYLACEIVARDRTIKEAGQVMTARIADNLNMDSRRREVALRSEVERLNAALQAIADEAGRHHEHNPISGTDRLPRGYTTVLNLACAALKS